MCSNCNCRIYHLDYQEELWAAAEEKNETQKKNKKSKNKKKKEKLKQKKAQQQSSPDPAPAPTDTKTEIPSGAAEPRAPDSVAEPPPAQKTEASLSAKKDSFSKIASPNASFDEEEEDEEAPQAQIDFVLYLQQTGSMIALAKLMDALEASEDVGDDFEELDDYERKMIREQQLLRQQ